MARWPVRIFRNAPHVCRPWRIITLAVSSQEVRGNGTYPASFPPHIKGYKKDPNNPGSSDIRVVLLDNIQWKLLSPDLCHLPQTPVRG